MGRKAVSCLLEILGVVFTALLLAAAVVSWRSSFISPEAGNFWASVALLMPVILALNLAALVWWLFRRKWGVALMPAAALALNLGYISAMVQLPDFNGKGPHDIRIATLNSYGFSRLGPTSVTAYGIASVMKRERVDVLCLQEFPENREFPADSIARLFAARMPYCVARSGQAILSRFPILDHRYVRFPDSGNDYLEADLRVGDDTVRVFSVHLQTSGISGLRRRFRRDYDRDAPVERVIGELERNSRIRAQQVREIPHGDRLDALPGHPCRGLQRHALLLYLPPAQGRHDGRLPGRRQWLRRHVPLSGRRTAHRLHFLRRQFHRGGLLHARRRFERPQGRHRRTQIPAVASSAFSCAGCLLAMVNVKVEPSPSFDSMVTSPPLRRVRSWTNCNPSPDPSSFFVP